MGGASALGVAAPAIPIAKPFGSVTPMAVQSISPLEQHRVKEAISSPTHRGYSALAKAEGGLGAAGEPANLEVCPGSNRQQCNENNVHRVCLKLLSTNRAGVKHPTIWGIDTSTPEGTMKDYWHITGKNSFRAEWWKQMADRDGDSRCVGVDSTAQLVKSVGCDAITIRCAATDLNYVFITDTPRTEGVDLKPLKACVKQQCNPGGVWDASETVQDDASVARHVAVMFIGCAAVVAALAMRRRTRSIQTVELLG